MQTSSTLLGTMTESGRCRRTARCGSGLTQFRCEWIRLHSALDPCLLYVPELAKLGGLTLRPGSSTSVRKVAPLSGAVDEKYSSTSLKRDAERNSWLL